MNRRALPRPNSLALRLFLSSAALTTIGLLAAGLILSNLYSRSVQQAFDAQLEAYANALIGALSAQISGRSAAISLSPPQNIGEARFLEPLSGWYWQIGEGRGAILFTSDSLIGSTLDFVMADSANAPDDMLEGPGGEAIRLFQRSYKLPNDSELLVAVAGNVTQLNLDIDDFRSSLLITFLVFAAFLGLAIYLQVRLGLRPLKAIRRALREVQAGRSQKVEGRFPSEIAPVVEEINGLIDANKGVVERARTHVGNLAHALKTPLSVIANEASGAAVKDRKITEQITVMRDQVNHYLSRARSAAGLAAVGTSTQVDPIVDSLVRAMEKIYRDKDLKIKVTMEDNIVFRGEKQDLEEVIGNLVDNASKWATSIVTVNTRKLNKTQWVLCVEDDGPGMTSEQCKLALKRGKRLDETVAGSGLGLSIVVETANLYTGSINLERSELGGLKAELTLPCVSEA
ncbi:HAMP domain-containing sensor histidine kinase [Pararhizobium sp. IMCC21322]|uniref:ATP-binding protein n=1 Tax=Pararhizobium sp. IMCC21322 TaxID=3067903 RepID=UPI0027406449|nr:HAMP domain-containing sensor histidine kinase [Pararhizobium sp. IMCC21322]